jgi:hypothetical protein
LISSDLAFGLNGDREMPADSTVVGRLIDSILVDSSVIEFGRIGEREMPVGSSTVAGLFKDPRFMGSCRIEGAGSLAGVEKSTAETSGFRMEPRILLGESKDILKGDVG